MVKEGFVRVPRKVLGMSVFRKEGALSRLEALLDLYRIARFEAGRVKWGKSGRIINLERGELVVTCAYLARRWHWGKTTVANFIYLICDSGVARRRMVGRTMVIAMLDAVEGDDMGMTEEKDTMNDIDGTETRTEIGTTYPLENNRLDKTAGTESGTESEHNNKKVIQEESRRENPHTPRAGEGRAEAEAFRAIPSVGGMTAGGETAARALPAPNPLPSHATAGTTAAKPQGADAEAHRADAAYAADLMNSPQALEQMAMGQGMTVAEVRDKLADFEMEMEATAQRHNGRTDYRRHFYNWLRLGREIGRRNALAEQRLRQRHMTKEESNREVMQSCLDGISARIAAAEHDEEARRFRREVLGRRE